MHVPSSSYQKQKKNINNQSMECMDTFLYYTVQPFVWVDVFSAAFSVYTEC